MKYVFLLMFLYLPAYLFAQKQPEKFKGANTITVVTGIPEDSLYLVFGKILLDNNYTFIDKDPQFKTIRARGIIPKYGHDLTLNVRVKDSTVIIKGFVISGKYRFDVWHDNKKNLFGVSFAEMDRVASALNGVAYYEKAGSNQVR